MATREQVENARKRAGFSDDKPNDNSVGRRDLADKGVTLTSGHLHDQIKVINGESD